MVTSRLKRVVNGVEMCDFASGYKGPEGVLTRFAGAAYTSSSPIASYRQRGLTALPEGMGGIGGCGRLLATGGRQGGRATVISVLFCSRVKDNPDSNLPRLLDTAVEHTSAEERKQIEFLIKYDSDDDGRPPDSFFAKYPFPVRTFCFARGEGRHYLHHAQEYLFAQRDPRSRFCLMTADDFRFTRSGFVSEILSIKDEFCILGHRRPPIESYAGIYEREEIVRQWVVAFGPWSPVVSSRLIEVCQNFGWQANVDSWLMGLSVVLYDLYKIIIWKQHEEFYARGGGYGLGDTPTYNNMELTCQKGPLNKYWFELVRRQARNIYLNMEHGTDLRRMSLSAQSRVLWQKIRSQPLRRLPARVIRKLCQTVGSIFA